MTRIDRMLRERYTFPTPVSESDRRRLEARGEDDLRLSRDEAQFSEEWEREYQQAWERDIRSGAIMGPDSLDMVGK